jgi:energy-coupling factor transporter ATP-binding protein EcfA2
LIRLKAEYILINFANSFFCINNIVRLRMSLYRSKKYNETTVALEVRGEKYNNYINVISQDVESELPEFIKHTVLETEAKNTWFFPIIDKDKERECILVSGKSGCGKTSFMKTYALIYQDLNPDNQIYYLSRKPDDPSLGKTTKRNGHLSKALNYKTIVINDNTVFKINYSHFKDCLILVDDAIFNEKEYTQYIDNFIKDILMLGRQSRISILVSKHILNNGHENQQLKNECDAFVMFPSRSPKQHVINYLKSCQLSKEDIQLATQSSSCYIMYRNTYPSLIMSDKFIKLL